MMISVQWKHGWDIDSSIRVIFVVSFVPGDSLSKPCWRHQMETFSALLVFCAANSRVTGEFPAQMPVMQSFEIFICAWINGWVKNGEAGDLRWRHQVEKFSALLALCDWNPSFTGGFPSKRPVTLSFEVFFYLRLNKRLSKQYKRWWFEMPWRSLWRHCNVSIHFIPLSAMVLTHCGLVT